MNAQFPLASSFVTRLREYLAPVAGVAVLTLACWFLTPLTDGSDLIVYA